VAQGEIVTYSFELVIVVLILITAGAAILVKDLISAAFILGSYSFFLALVWAWMGAVDLAFVEAVVGAGLGTVFFLLTLFQVDPKAALIRRTAPPLAALVSLPPLGLLLLYAAGDLPAFGDAASPASTHVSPVYLENSLKDTLTPNVVTSIIMDYRGFDTLIETCVIFTAGIACAAVTIKEKLKR
jgi:multicomponent Na+:H+ antiporter subunit B